MGREMHKFLIECEVTLDQEEMDEWFQKGIDRHGSLFKWFQHQALCELENSEPLQSLAVYEEEKYDGGIESGGNSLMSFKIKEN